MLGRRVMYSLMLLAMAPLAAAQNALPFNNAAVGPGGNNVMLGPGQGQGLSNGSGGGANADFDSLIDLIASTVASETWAENGGGEAEIRPFVGGVWADAQGVLREASANRSTEQGRAALAADLAKLRTSVASRVEAALGKSAMSGSDARRPSGLRCISLPRLEKEMERLLAAGQPLDEAMLTLAGLQRVEYVLVFPESGDLVLAGPAGDWRVSDEQRLVATDTGLPVVRLDDLLTMMRRDPRSPFGCSIDPRPESLAAAQAYITEHPIPSGRRGRDRWLEQVRDQVGLQDLSYLGMPGDTRIACVLGEADYHMKLIGMGLADGVAGMQSYLDSIRVKPGEPAPAVGAVRWWFGMNYAAVEQSDERDAFHLVGQGVKVMSENEAIAARGARRPTGQSDELSAGFATSFTANFAALCDQYPVYAELRNVFDLALVTALIQSHDLLPASGWQPGLMVTADALRLPRYAAPTAVDTVANLRVVNRRHVVAGVSGGVWAQPTEVLAKRMQASKPDGPMQYAPTSAPEGASNWWWDAE
ncbi:hypothetical protein Pla123a_13430 [Posidoniimonas polymericola]|uniref:DUF1598 domain-containing protein n=1 Tax=Posidoniimonas polymericola TaxID=2528002 RepID=A0A5C5YUP8_9BACT|nr:DUF1598 domain-containing protein [Posidoniimonas polymericola]TWT78550.1 hypothetical protein Pla123a_13430 [Posidoniimonas polymericola]